MDTLAINNFTVTPLEKYLLTNHNLQKHVFSKQNCHNCNCHNCHFVSNYSPFSLRIREINRIFAADLQIHGMKRI